MSVTTSQQNRIAEKPTTYRLLDNVNGDCIAEGSVEDCMHAWLTEDGQTYSIQPSMIDETDDEGSVIGQRQRTTESGTLEWTMWTGRRGQSERATFRDCWGNTEDEARADLLRSLYKEGVYSHDGRWSIEEKMPNHPNRSKPHAGAGSVTKDWNQIEDTSKWRVVASDGTETYFLHCADKYAAADAWNNCERLFLADYDTGSMGEGEKFLARLELLAPHQPSEDPNEYRCEIVVTADGRGKVAGYDGSTAALSMYYRDQNG